MERITEASIAIIVGLAIMISAICALVKNRKRYALRVDAKCIGYETEKEYLQSLPRKGQNKLDRIIEERTIEDSKSELRAPIYEGTIDGKKVKFRGMSAYYLPGAKKEVLKGKIVKLSVNPEDHTDYTEKRNAGMIVLIIIGAFCIMAGIGIMIDKTL